MTDEPNVYKQNCICVSLYIFSQVSSNSCGVRKNRFFNDTTMAVCEKSDSTFSMFLPNTTNIHIFPF